MLGIAVITVFIVSIWYLNENYSLKIWGDEFGYWSSAAYINGKDWSSVASTNSYYGFGFGILLAPIMAIFGSNSITMLQVALVMEAVMLSSCVIAAYLCVDYFSENIKGIARVIIALVPIVYPSNILFVNTTMAEILLVTLTWWYSYLVLRFIKEKSLGLAISLMVLAIYMYSVHQRTIAVMAITLLIIIWVYRKRLLNSKVFVSIGILVVGLIAVLAFKEVYVNAMYANVSETTYSYNNLSGQTSKIVKIMTTSEGFVKFIYSLIGKFYYITVASCMLVLFGFYDCCRKVIKAIIAKTDFEQIIGIVVICLNFLAAYLIGAIYMSDGFNGRTDILIYGRYMEHTIGPLILLGIIYLYENKITNSIVSMICITGIAAVITEHLIYDKSSNSNIWANCSAIADLFGRGNYVNSEGIYVAFIRSCILLLFLLLGIHLRKYMKNIFVNLVLLGIGITWISTGYEVRNDKVIWWADELFVNQRQVLRHIDENEFGIYSAYIGGFFQFLRVDSKVNYYANMEQIEELNEPMYIITYTEADVANQIREEQDVVFENDMYILWRSNPEG